MCYVNQCKDSNVKVTNVNNIQELHSMNTPQSSENEPVNVQLCSHHYMQWYKEIHMVHIKCKICGKSIQNYRKSRIFPEPELVQHFLLTNTDFNDTLSRTCYKVMYKLHQPCVWTCQNRADRPEFK